MITGEFVKVGRGEDVSDLLDRQFKLRRYVGLLYRCFVPSPTAIGGRRSGFAPSGIVFVPGPKAAPSPRHPVLNVAFNEPHSSSTSSFSSSTSGVAGFQRSALGKARNMDCRAAIVLWREGGGLEHRLHDGGNTCGSAQHRLRRAHTRPSRVLSVAGRNEAEIGRKEQKTMGWGTCHNWPARNRSSPLREISSSMDLIKLF